MKSTFYYLVTPFDGKEFSSMGKHGLILGANIENHKNTKSGGGRGRGGGRRR